MRGAAENALPRRAVTGITARSDFFCNVRSEVEPAEEDKGKSHERLKQPSRHIGREHSPGRRIAIADLRRARDGVVTTDHRHIWPGHLCRRVVIAWNQSGTQTGQTTFNTLVGAVVTLVSTISGYYFGSSVGSQKKDDVIQSALATAQGAPPPGK